MNISKADYLIVNDKDGNFICKIKIGMVSLTKMHDKTQILTIKESK